MLDKIIVIAIVLGSGSFGLGFLLGIVFSRHIQKKIEEGVE